MTATSETASIERTSPPQSRLPFADAELLAVRILPAEFARVAGVSRQSVSRWIKSGIVTLGADGRLDPTRAMRQLIRHGDPGRLRARLIKLAVADVADLRRQAGRALQLEEDLAAVQAHRSYLETYSRELDLATELLPDILVDAWPMIRSTSEDGRRELFADLVERAVLLAGTRLGTIEVDAGPAAAAEEEDAAGEATDALCAFEDAKGGRAE